MYLPRAGHGAGDPAGRGQRCLTFTFRPEHDSIGDREVGVIEHVEHFEPHLDVSAAAENGQIRIFYEREIRHRVLRAGQAVASRVAEKARRLEHESRRVEVLFGTTEDQVIGIDSRPEIGSVFARRVARTRPVHSSAERRSERHPAAQRHDPIDLPPADPAAIRRAGKVPHEVRRKGVPDVEIGARPVTIAVVRVLRVHRRVADVGIELRLEIVHRLAQRVGGLKLIIPAEPLLRAELQGVVHRAPAAGPVVDGPPIRIAPRRARREELRSVAQHLWHDGIPFDGRDQLVRPRSRIARGEHHLARELALGGHVVGDAVRLLDVVVDRSSAAGDRASGERRRPWKRRTGERRIGRKRGRRRGDPKGAVERTVGIVIDAGAPANGRPSIARHVPRKSGAWREVPSRWVFGERRPARGEVGIGEDVSECRVQTVHFGRKRVELVPEAEVQGDAIAQPEIVLPVETKQRVGPLAKEYRPR